MTKYNTKTLHPKVLKFTFLLSGYNFMNQKQFIYIKKKFLKVLKTHLEDTNYICLISIYVTYQNIRNNSKNIVEN